MLQVPDAWELLPPGDAALTRRAKAGGPSWTVQEKKGRRTFSCAKGEKTQPNMKTLAQLTLYQTTGEISAQGTGHDCDQEMPGLQDRICHR